MKERLFTLFLCLFILTVQTLAQQKSITGRVTDENAQPLPGVRNWDNLNFTFPAL